MPSLINNPDNMTDLAQNYRRVATGGSNYGTRRIQFYTIAIYGLSDAVVDALNDYRVVNNTEIDIDQEPEREFMGGTIVEVILRKVQEATELFFVGAHDVDQEEPGYNDVFLTVGVAGDTFSSGWEMDERDPDNTTRNYNFFLRWQLEHAVDSYTNGYYDSVEAYPVMIYGDHLTDTGMYSIAKPELKAARAALKAARVAAGAPASKNPK